MLVPVIHRYSENERVVRVVSVKFSWLSSVRRVRLTVKERPTRVSVCLVRISDPLVLVSNWGTTVVPFTVKFNLRSFRSLCELYPSDAGVRVKGVTVPTPVLVTSFMSPDVTQTDGVRKPKWVVPWKRTKTKNLKKPKRKIPFVHGRSEVLWRNLFVANS